VHVEGRHVDYVMRRIYHMEGSQIIGGMCRPRKTIHETIQNDLEINEIEKDIVFHKTL